jgi:thiol-disulfide isomerase/thioredoxin
MEKRNMKTKRKINTIILSIILILGILQQSINVSAAKISDSYEHVEKITTNQMFEQREPNYYVYFYSENCSACNFVKDKVLNFSKENKVYFIDYSLSHNHVGAYDWNSLREKYNKKVGYLDENEEIVFLPGESYEKYENQKNMYGKKITYSYRIIGNDVYTNIMTPEIDYSSINNVEEMVIAGVPTLFYIEDKCIKEFYFDSFEIDEFIK